MDSKESKKEGVKGSSSAKSVQEHNKEAVTSENICSLNDSEKTRIHELFDIAADGTDTYHIGNQFRAMDLAQAYAENLYNLQLRTSSLVEFARACRDLNMLEKLARQFNKAYAHLASRADGAKLWIDVSRIKNGDEVVLYSSQFLFALARILRVSEELKGYGSVLDQFRLQYGTLLKDHLLRWIDGEKSMWNFAACSDAFSYRAYTYRDYMRLKMENKLAVRSGAPLYCSKLHDMDLWTGAAALETLEAHKVKGTSLPPLSDNEASKLKSFSQLVLDVFESRLKFVAIGGNCKDCEGVRIDRDYMESFNQNLGFDYPPAWDISHARRFPLYLQSVYVDSAILKSRFASERVLKALANTLAYEVLSGNDAAPEISSFIDGGTGAFQGKDLRPYYYSCDFGLLSNYSGELARRHTVMLADLEAKLKTASLPPILKYFPLSFQQFSYFMFAASQSTSRALKDRKP